MPGDMASTHIQTFQILAKQGGIVGSKELFVTNTIAIDNFTSGRLLIPSPTGSLP